MKWKKSVVYIGGVIAVILAVFSLCACGARRSYAEVYKNNWGIEMPENMEIEFYKSDFDGLAGQGDEIRYTVFRLADAETDFFEDFCEKKAESIESAAKNLITIAEFEVPAAYLPNWEADYSWKHVADGKYLNGTGPRDNLYMLYFSDAFKLICIESFQ